MVALCRHGNQIDLCAVSDGAACTSSPAAANLATILTALILSLFVAALDSTIVSTAFHSSGYTWIGNSYLLAMAASIPLRRSFRHLGPGDRGDHRH